MKYLYPPTSTSPHLNYLRNCTVSEVIRWADVVCVSGCTALVELSVSHQSERERERDIYIYICFRFTHMSSQAHVFSCMFPPKGINFMWSIYAGAPLVFMTSGMSAERKLEKRWAIESLYKHSHAP